MIFIIYISIKPSIELSIQLTEMSSFHQGVGMSGHTFDAFVSSQRTFNEHDWAAKLQEKYWKARQKFLAKVERKEDACIVLSDSKLDAKLEIYRSIDKSCAKLIDILEDYQNFLYIFANEENSLGILLKECSKHDKTNAGKIQAVVGKSLTQSSHQRIRLYSPLLRMYQEMETFHSRAVADTTETVDRLESKRSQYRASLLWMKDISEKLDPDIYRQLDKFRRVQNQVRSDKKVFDDVQMDVVQKIDLLMASRCNLVNHALASYQAILQETFEKNYNNFKSIEQLIKKEDIYEYEFKTLKQLNPLKLSDDEDDTNETGTALEASEKGNSNDDNNNNQHKVPKFDEPKLNCFSLIDLSTNDEHKDDVENNEDTLCRLSHAANEVITKEDQEKIDMVNSGDMIDLMGSDEVIDELRTLFGKTL